MSRPGGGGWGHRAVRNRRHDRLSQLDPYEFERVVADYYRRIGYTVEHCGTGRSRSRFDGGIDLKMYREGRYTVVQCKRENARQVTHNVGHELLGVMLTEKADQAIVVNTGEFTPYAWQSARKDPRLQLIDGDELRDMLPEYAVIDASPASSIHGKRPLDRPLSGAPSRATPANVRYRSTGKEQDSSGVKALVAFGVLIPLVVWQCSWRSGPERTASSVRAPLPRVAEPKRRARPEVHQPASSQVATPAPRIDSGEAQRRAEESMRIIRETTAELLLPPDPHAVYQQQDSRSERR